MELNAVSLLMDLEDDAFNGRDARMIAPDGGEALKLYVDGDVMSYLRQTPGYDEYLRRDDALDWIDRRIPEQYR